jgi:hypothetical protein
MDKKKAKNKVVPSAPDEEKSANGEKEKPVIEKKPITPDTIFLADKIDKLFNAKDPIESINVLLQDHFRKINGNANFDEEKLRAEAEFHVNNLVFVKQNFPNFDNETISSLMNILGKLIKFKNASKHINPKILPNESQASVGSIDISGNQFPPEDVSNLNNNNNKNVSPQNQNVNPQNNPNENNNNSPEKNNSQEENKEENADNCEGEKNIEQENENENENNNIEDVDFLFLSKDKLNELQESLNEENLMPKTKSDFAFANKKDKTRTNGKFFLNYKEIDLILKYIQTNYLPYIRMWYYFQNDQRRVTERKIEVIINTPTLINMPLSMATQEKTDEEKMAEEEEKRKKMEEEKKIEEENQKKEEEELKKQEENKKLMEEQNKEETYLDLLERLGLNEETKKIIIEKIEELHREVDGKIDNRKKTLDDKIREIDVSVHGKKK